MKFGLGTVQWGFLYGITNKQKTSVSLTEINKIKTLCKKYSIDLLDTSYDYGNSENNIEKIFIKSSDPLNIKIISKDSVISKNKIDITLKEISQKFGKNFHGFLLHDENILLNKSGKNIYKHIIQAKNKGFFKKFGVSFYSIDKLIETVQKFKLDIVQIPCNILDQRFLPVLPKLKQLGIEIHVRSIFLQGVLLEDVNKLPSYFNQFYEIKKWNDLTQQNKKLKLTLTLNFIKKNYFIDYIIIGTLSSLQLLEIIELWNNLTIYNVDFSLYKSKNLNLIEPYRWSIND